MQTMNRQRMITTLQSKAPAVIQVAGTSDMGFEFTAIVPTGVIYPEPGMLLNYSGGKWPPQEWETKSDEEQAKLLRIFLLDEIWVVTPWEALSDEEILKWLESIEM